MSESPAQVAPAVPPAVPDDLRPYPQFVLWRLEPDPARPDKPRKVPYNAVTRHRASATDPTTWAGCDTALEAYAAQPDAWGGIGFVFTEADPFVFVDLDDCRNATTGAYSDHAQRIFAMLPGAWEVSQSGNGLHGVGRADASRLATKRNKWTDDGNKIECYSTERFMAIGGGGWTGAPSTDWTDSLVAWVPDGGPANDTDGPEWIDAARPGYDGPTDDTDLIRRALASKGMSKFGHTATFEQLWTADPALGEFWPDDGGQGRRFDHSSADLALANALAWWTGCNPVRMLRLFQQSTLWRGDERKARMAIAKAVADPDRKYHSRAQRLREDVQIGDDLTTAPLPDILTTPDALTELAFVGDGSQVVSRTTKRTRKYADALHEWAASIEWIETGSFDSNGRPKMKGVPVIKRWVESPSRLSVDALTWWPGRPEFCAPPERTQAGDRAYNLWTPPAMLPVPIDWQAWAQPFVDHVAYLVPVEHERERFLSWVAHIFQHPGVLPHCCYLMVATQTGIGRGTLASILVRALRGYVAANMDVDALFGGFNGRLSQKLLATVDEVREGNARDRYAKAEAFKSKLTEGTRALNPKYGAQSVERNCCRWLLFSNHLDALPFDPTDRRVIVIENPTARAGADWYGYLHGLLDRPEFVGAVQHYLATRDLSDFNAHEPAPLNAAKQSALRSLESDATRACRQFAREWPGELATMNDLRRFIGEGCPGDRALEHAMGEAGMVSTGHRVTVERERPTVIIVRGMLTPANVIDGDNTATATLIKQARFAFAFGQPDSSGQQSHQFQEP